MPTRDAAPTGAPCWVDLMTSDTERGKAFYCQLFGWSEPGTPSWFELHTRDYQAAVTFYREALGWDTQVVADTPEFRYTTLRQGDGWLAGVPAHWSEYFEVDDTDTDAAPSKIVDPGGPILMAAEDTPYGRLAAAADPAGARFKLVAANEAMPGNVSSP